MANFVLLFSGGTSARTDAERAKVMEAWGGWMGKLGDKLVDQGNPFAPDVKMVSTGGAVHEGALGDPATGYSILKASSLSAAAELAKGCPILQSGGKVTVYEITPM